MGSCSETGLDAGAVDGAMSEDAIQYAPDKQAAMSEAARATWAVLSVVV